MKIEITEVFPQPQVTQLSRLTVTIVRPTVEVLRMVNEPGAKQLLELDLGKAFDKLKKLL